MFGVLSYFSLGLEDNPRIDLPIVTVTAVYPGASAETVEVQVTRRIEDAVSSMGSIKTISSTSQTSVSQVTVEFTEGTDVDVAASDIQQKVSGIRRDLPAEARVAEPVTDGIVQDAPVLAETSGPAATPVLATASGLVHASTLVMTPGTSQTIKLLVVDDVPSVRRGLRMRLSLESDLMVVGEAASGEEALAVVRSLQPDVILMDIEMPGLDGLVTTAAMRSVAPNSAVVTLSLHDDSASREKALAAGATAFVGKHEASEALLTAIRDAAHPAA